MSQCLTQGQVSFADLLLHTQQRTPVILL